MKHQRSSTARHGRASLIAVLATAATLGALAAGQPAAAQVAVSAGVGVLAGNVVQIPVTAVVPVQVCNNAISIGVISIPANLLGSARGCDSQAPAVLGDELRRSRSTAKQRHRHARHARSARRGTRRGG